MCSTGAAALVAALEAHDVEVVFGLPGIHALPVWDALIGSPIRRVVVRHEQAAGFGAVGYARTSDRPGVYLTSTGPGAFNSLAALSEADASSTPVLHLTSQIPTDLVGAGRGYLHESRGQSQAFAAVSRFHARPTTPEALVAAVDEAFRQMALDPGPATIEVATDVMAAVTEAGPARVTRVAAPAPDPAAVARVRALIDAAEAPLIWAGGGARHAAAAVRALAEALDAPVITTYNGKGVLPSGASAACGLVGRGGGDAAAGRALRPRARARHPLLAGGHRELGRAAARDDRPGRPRSGPLRAHVRRRRGSGGRRRPLLRRAPGRSARPPAAATARRPCGRRCRAARPRSEQQGADAEVELMRVLHEALPDDAIVVADMTVAAYWAALYLDAKRPGALRVSVVGRARVRHPAGARDGRRQPRPADGRRSAATAAS